MGCFALKERKGKGSKAREWRRGNTSPFRISANTEFDALQVYF